MFRKNNNIVVCEFIILTVKLIIQKEFPIESNKLKKSFVKIKPMTCETDEILLLEIDKVE